MADLIGKSVYQFEENTGATNDPINVYYYKPSTWKAGDDIVIAMHGVYRDAEDYLEDLATYANKKNFLLICPEFSNEKYPGSRYYNNGNVMNGTRLQSKSDQVFSAIDRILNDAKTRFDSLNSKTLLYGHSAGAQIVHRYAIFNNATNFDLIVCANAGGYTMPDSTISFPYGVGGVPISNEEWKTIFSKPVVILLGEEDIVQDDNLNVNEAANAQGKNRFERGKNFYKQMKNKAEELNVAFNWQLSTVPEVGHNYYLMAKPALELFSNTAQMILTLDDSGEVPETLDASIRIVNASECRKDVKIIGNRLDNSLVGGSGNNTLDGGEQGDDTLTGGKGSDVFIYGGGNDVVTNYSGEDMIHITSGKIDSYSFDGGDLIFKIGNGSLRLKNMTNHAITVKDSTGETTTQIYGNGYSPQQVIKNLVKAWGQTLLANKSTEKLDESIQLCSQFKTIQEVIDKMVADCRAAGDAETFLRDYCGIILNNEDTGAITGWNTGGLSIKTADNIVGETLSSLKHVPDYTNTTFKTSQDVAVNLSSTGDSLTADGKKFFDAVYSWWAEESLKLIEESYGVNFKAGDEINIALTPSASYSGHTSGGKDISINLQSVWFNDENNYTDNSIDRTLAHEFTHVAQSLFMGRFPKFLQEGFADLTCGVDDRGGKYGNIEILASNADSLSSYLNLNNYDTGNSYYYAAGYMFLRYLAKQASDSYDSSKSYAWKDGSSITGTDDAELLTGNAKNQTLSAGAGNDTVTAYGEKMKIFGDDGDDYILTGTNAKNLTISAGAGNDSIQNYGEKVKINAGAGKDTIYSKSNFATIDGGKGNDSIENRGGSKVTIVGGAGNDTIRNNNRDEYNYDEQKWETVSKPDNVTISSGKGNDHIFNEGSKVKITSGAGNDYISNDGANVTINGGTGNDTLSGKAKTFIYADGDGNDVITSYSSDTTINLTNGSIGSSSLDGSDVILNIGNGSIRLKYSSDKKITIKDAKGKVTSKTYTNKNLLIKGTKGNDTLKAGKGSNITINADKGNDYIVNCADKTSLNGENGNDILINGGYWEEERGGKNATLYGGKGNDTLISHGLKSSLDGGKGNDSIINGYRYYEPWKAFYDPDNENYNGSNSTISGGTGNDSIKNCGKNVVFTYKAGDGNDLIQGFNATSTLNISGSVYSTKTSGSNVIVKVGKGMVTLSGAATLPALNIKCDKVLNLTDKSKSKVTATSAVEFVNASVRTKAISIKGNALNNSITGGNGNDSIAGRAGKDTLRGGKGNDKLWGGDGADTFIYDSGDGQDIIYGFDNSDMLQITGAFSASYKKSKKEIYFKVGSTSKAITLKNFTATSFNVNGTSYQINGSKLK